MCLPPFLDLPQPSRHFSALVVSAVLLAPSAAAAQWRSAPVLVRFVLDGDTIDVASVGRVRLLGIDAPEIGRGLDTAAPFAREAQQRLAGLVAHRWVRLEYEDGRDLYRRRLAYVFLETGQFVNELLVREGLARVIVRRGLTRLGELKRAEAAAQASRRGIWGDRPSIPSETYRLPRPKRPVRKGRGAARGDGARKPGPTRGCRAWGPRSDPSGCWGPASKKGPALRTATVRRAPVLSDGPRRHPQN